MIESGINHGLQSGFGETKARPDKILIKPRGMRACDQFWEIGTHEWFASGEVRVQHAEFSPLLEDGDPFFGGKLRAGCGHFQWIRTIDAVQRAAGGDLGDEGW